MAALATSAALAMVGPSAIETWRNDPVRFVYDVFGEGYKRETGRTLALDGWQDKVIRDRSRKKAVRACKNPGKTAVDALEAWNFLATRQSPNVIATSVTGANLRDGLWKEMAKWQRFSPLLTKAFEWTSERIFLREAPGDWFMSARTWSRSATPEDQGKALAGIHSDYVLFILDEAGGIPDAVAVTAEAALGSGVETRIVLTGNPTDLSGPLWRACCTRARSQWSVHEITGEPGNPLRAPRVSEEWAKNMLDEWGPDSNYYRINVLGEFPSSSADALMSVDDVLRAMRRDPREEVYQHSARIHGVDVARNGRARSVIFERQGALYLAPRIYRDLVPDGLMTLAEHVADLYREREPDAVNIDGTGMGGGVVDRCKQLKVARLNDVNFGSKARDPKRFRNRRSEMWWDLAMHVKKEAALPEAERCPSLIEELTSIRYRTHPASGLIELEGKDDVEARLGFSPDLGDAAALTHAVPVLARAVRESPEFKSVTANRSAARNALNYNPLAKG